MPARLRPEPGPAPAALAADDVGLRAASRAARCSAARSARAAALGGWRAVFVFGGVVPLVIAALMLRYMPESMQFGCCAGAGSTGCSSGCAASRPACWWMPPAATWYMRRSRTARRWPSSSRCAARATLLGASTSSTCAEPVLPRQLAAHAGGRRGLQRERSGAPDTLLQVGGGVGTVAMGPLIDRVSFCTACWCRCLALAVLTIALIGPARAAAARPCWRRWWSAASHRRRAAGADRAGLERLADHARHQRWAGAARPWPRGSIAGRWWRAG